MAEKVEYTISLMDAFSGTLSKIDHSIAGSEAKIEGLGKKGEGVFANLGRSIGLAFVGFEAFAFLKDSVKAFDESAKASAQLETVLASTGNASGLTKEALDAQAASLMTMSTYDDDAITGAQSLLATFTDIKGEVFTNTIPVLADLSTAMGQDLKSSAIQVGKALNNPTEGISALTRVGVTFTEQQKKQIAAFQKGGQMAKAQQIILAELNKEFGGSAKAASESGLGAIQKLTNQFGNFQEQVGGVVVALLNKFVPVLSTVVNAMSGAFDFLVKNSDTVKDIAIAIGIAVAPILIYQAGLLAVTAATSAWAGIQTVINFLLTANPIGIVVLALAALAGGIYLAWKKSETFRGVILGVWEVLKSLADPLMAIGELIVAAFSFDPIKIQKSFEKVVDTFKNLDFKKSFEVGFEKGKDKESNIGELQKKTKNDTSKKGAFAGGDSTKGVTDKISGSKPQNIYITIQKLIESQNITTTNLTEGATKIKDMVSEAIIMAVNDINLLASA